MTDLPKKDQTKQAFTLLPSQTIQCTNCEAIFRTDAVGRLGGDSCRCATWFWKELKPIMADRSSFHIMGSETGRYVKDQVGRHPAEHADFGKTQDMPVWWLSHPLAADDKFTFQQNLDHVLHMMKLCLAEGYRVIAPYHTICLLEEETEESRRVGLEIDCSVAAMLGHMILCGHKMSSGMVCEYDALTGSGKPFRFIDVIGFHDSQVQKILRSMAAEYNRPRVKA